MVCPFKIFVQVAVGAFIAKAMYDAIILNQERRKQNGLKKDDPAAPTSDAKPSEPAPAPAA